MIALAVETGIEPGVWAGMGIKGIATAVELVEQRNQRLARHLGTGRR